MNTQEQNIRLKLESVGVPEEKIDEIIITYPELKLPEEEIKNISFNERVIIQNEMDKEKDWKRRAILAARIISIELDK